MPAAPRTGPYTQQSPVSASQWAGNSALREGWYSRSRNLTFRVSLRWTCWGGAGPPRSSAAGAAVAFPPCSAGRQKCVGPGHCWLRMEAESVICQLAVHLPAATAQSGAPEGHESGCWSLAAVAAAAHLPPPILVHAPSFAWRTGSADCLKLLHA